MKNGEVIVRLGLFNLIVLSLTGYVTIDMGYIFGYVLFVLIIITMGLLDVLLYHKNKMDRIDEDEICK